MSKIRLSNCTDTELNSLFLRNSDSLTILTELDQELRKRGSSFAKELYVKVIRNIRMNQQSRSPKSGDLLQTWVQKFLARHNLSAPNGQELYKYRMTDEEYSEARIALGEMHLDRYLKTDRFISAVFTAFAAEWFRRESDGAFHVWNRIAPDILTQVPDATKRELAETGLRFWGRTLRIGEFGREFILSVALEGGFPIQVIKGDGKKNLKSFLSAVMRRSLAYESASIADIEMISWEESSSLVTTYRKVDFLKICAELVDRVLHWKRQIDNADIGNVDPVTYLDMYHANWRSDIPLYLPSGEQELVNSLLSGLLREIAGRLISSGVGCDRYLEKIQGYWQPSLHLIADGDLDLRKFVDLDPTKGRLHVVPSGQLAQCMTRSFALIEPPASSSQAWRVRPTVKFNELLGPFPFQEAVTVTLTSMARPHSMVWPRGDAIRSKLLVFAPADESPILGHRLKLVGQGSTRSPHERLCTLIPIDWKAVSKGDDCEQNAQEIPELNSKLVQVSERTLFYDPSDLDNPYLVEPQKDAIEARVIFVGRQLEKIWASKELWHLPLDIQIQEKGKLRLPTTGEVLWRRVGEPWHDCSRIPIEEGVVDISWRENESGIQLDRFRIFVLPRNAELTGKMVTTNKAEIYYKEFTNWKFEFEGEIGLTAQVSSSEIKVTFSGPPNYRLSVTLIPPKGERFTVLVPLPGYYPVIVSASGSIVREGERIDLSHLRGALAVSPRPTELYLDLKSRKQFKSAFSIVPLEGELALASLRSLAEELLASTDEQDACIEMSFAGVSGRPVILSRYRMNEVKMHEGWLPKVESITDCVPVFRTLLNPWQEHPFVAINALNSEGWRLPQEIAGFGLVYLRHGNDVVSRPTLVNSNIQPPLTPPGSLSESVGLSNLTERSQTISNALKRLSSDLNDDGQEFRWLIDTILNLRNLPPMAIDALKILPTVPACLARLLFRCRDTNERLAVWQLERELPFVWLALPLTSWRTAIVAEYQYITSALKSLSSEDAEKFAIQHVLKCTKAIAEIEPALDEILKMSIDNSERKFDPVAIRSLAALHIQYIRGVEETFQINRVQRASVLTRVVAKHELELPPGFNFDLESFEELLVPAILSACALGKFILDSECLLAIRRGHRVAPGYVTAAYPLFLAFYNRRMI